MNAVARTQGPQTWVVHSAAMAKTMDLASKYAASDGAVLILGETGTGKGVMAAWIHSRSLRKNKPFIVVNCAALPENLAESELFGHEKGAFSDAVSDKKGLIEIAQEGSVYLDDVEELPLNVQAKLLNLLSTGVFYKLGGTTPLSANIRVLASAGAELEKKAKQGDFRKDLYYRLAVFVLTMPPLRQRLEDIKDLSLAFAEQTRHPTLKRMLDRPSVLAWLLAQSWSGNVRELKNWVERCAAENKVLNAPAEDAQITAVTLKEAEAKFRKAYALRVLEEVDGNKTKAAMVLGLSRTHFMKMMKEWEQGVK